jgi:hypothetical protein
MKKITHEEAREVLLAREKNGLKIDNRLLNEIEKGDLYLILLEDEHSFLSLIWHAIDDSRLLTPQGQPRTLRDVAQRIKDNHYSFKDLSSDLGFNSDQHNPGWFEECKRIDDNFDINKFGWIALTPATEDELRSSPTGTFYIYDGTHKSLVLAKRLLDKSIDFEPLDCLLLIPRRN